MKKKIVDFVTYRTLAEALFDEYESIYDIDILSSAYRCYHQSKAYRELKLENGGDDFFADLAKNIDKTIAEEDRHYVQKMLTRNKIMERLSAEKYYTLLYRIQKDDDSVFYQLRAIRQTVNRRTHIVIGVKNVDYLVRKESAHKKEIDVLLQKGRNYLRAIADNSAGFIEANLTENTVSERRIHPVCGGNQDSRRFPDMSLISSSYSELQAWIADEIVCDNKEAYKKISSREFLMSSFENQEDCVSVSFRIQAFHKSTYPYKEVFYLYKERQSNHVHSLCVLYDLTEQLT